MAAPSSNSSLKQFTPEFFKEHQKERGSDTRSNVNSVGTGGAESSIKSTAVITESGTITPNILRTASLISSSPRHTLTRSPSGSQPSSNELPRVVTQHHIRPYIYGSMQESSHSLKMFHSGHDPIVRLSGVGGGNTAGSSRRRASVVSYNSAVHRHQVQDTGMIGDGSTGLFPRLGMAGTLKKSGTPNSLKVRPVNSGDDFCKSKSTTSAFSIPKIKPSSSAVSKTETNDDQAFQPIVGKLIRQMTAHYFWYGWLLLFGYITNWIGETRPATICIYISVSFVVVQVSRVIYWHNAMSLIPSYMSLIPFLLFCLQARESHPQFSVLWSISMIVINMQCGAKSLKAHILMFWLCSLLTYVFALSLLYECSPLNIFNFQNGNSIMRELNYIRIKVEEEGAFILAMLLILLGVFMLQRYINQYAFFLIDRQRRMDRLKAANAELRNRLRSLKTDQKVHLDLDSPITKVIQIVKSIQVKNKLDDDIVDTLDYVISILSSNQLFKMNLDAFNTHIDQDVKSWLDNMLQVKETNASPELNIGNPIAFSESQAGLGNETYTSTPALGANLIQGSIVDPDPLVQIPKPIQGSNQIIQQALSSAESWEFDCFHLAQVTNGRPLYYLAQHIFEKYEFNTLFSFDRTKIDQFLIELESGYRLNPYHNSIHGADVMQGVYYFMITLGMGDLISIEERLACILAGACHDIDHPGVSNAFLIESRSDLAVLYNDQSVLENYHCSKTFQLLLTNPKTNFLASLPKKTVLHIRQCMIKMILATDMAMHYELHTKFKNKIAGVGINVKDVKDRQLLLEIAIKCADVSNPTRPPPISQKWTELVMTEFYQQGDIERSLNLPISRFMDRYSPGVGKCQLGFIEFVVLPMYETWDQYMNEDDLFQGLKHLSTNREFWKTFQDPVGVSTPPSLSGIPTPDYLKSVLGRPTVLTPFAKVFSDLPTVCTTALPILTKSDSNDTASAKPKNKSIKLKNRPSLPIYSLPERALE